MGTTDWIKYGLIFLGLILLAGFQVKMETEELNTQRIENEANGFGYYTNAEIKKQQKEQAKINTKAESQIKKQEKLSQIENEKNSKLLEKQNQIDSKNLAKAQVNDQLQLEKIATRKIALEELLVSTAEPTMYVIAPMSYDTKKFVEDNSHDSAMFGLKTVDNSVERLTLLESCITDFQNKIDIKTGVSFLDRSKISQIEKEHKFQLSDWSNETKTAEIGKALNSNILLFLDKFGFVNTDKGEYHFEAKFVDLNTMKSATYNIVYKNPKKKIETPEIVQRISFRDFTAISTKVNPFEDEISMKALRSIRTVQKTDIKDVCPFGNVAKVETSEYDLKMPKTELFNVKSMNFDGFSSEVEFIFDEKTESAKFRFEPIEKNLVQSGMNYWTDGNIGTLTIENENAYSKYEVYSTNLKEFYIHLGSAEVTDATVHYYLQLIRQ